MVDSASGTQGGLTTWAAAPSRASGRRKQGDNYGGGWRPSSHVQVDSTVDSLDVAEEGLVAPTLAWIALGSVSLTGYLGVRRRMRLRTTRPAPGRG